MGNHYHSPTQPRNLYTGAGEISHSVLLCPAVFYVFFGLNVPEWTCGSCGGRCAPGEGKDIYGASRLSPPLLTGRGAAARRRRDSPQALPITPLAGRDAPGAPSPVCRSLPPKRRTLCHKSHPVPAPNRKYMESPRFLSQSPTLSLYAPSRL